MPIHGCGSDCCSFLDLDLSVASSKSFLCLRGQVSTGSLQSGPVAGGSVGGQLGGRRDARGARGLHRATVAPPPPRCPQAPLASSAGSTTAAAAAAPLPFHCCAAATLFRFRWPLLLMFSRNAATATARRRCSCPPLQPPRLLSAAPTGTGGQPHPCNLCGRRLSFPSPPPLL